MKKILNVCFLTCFLGKSFANPIAFNPDFYHLAEIWSKEHARDNGNWEVEWVDFGAFQPKTREVCEKLEFKYQKKVCQTEIKHLNTELKISETLKAQDKKAVLFRNDYTNISNKTDKISLNKEISYTDGYSLINDNYYPMSLVKVWIRLPLKDKYVHEPIIWDPSSLEKQNHNKQETLTIKEQISLTPLKKTIVELLAHEINYEAFFSTEIIIDGFFSYKQLDGWLPWNKGKVLVWSVQEPIRHIINNPEKYGARIKEIIKNYSWGTLEEDGLIYDIAKYIIKGKIDGAFVHKTETTKRVSPLDLDNSEILKKFLKFGVISSGSSFLFFSCYQIYRKFHNCNYETIR